jgi:transporter family protein
VFPLLVGLFSGQFRFVWRNFDYYVAVVGGIAGSIGGLFYYLALARGEASRVVVITATYPVLTVILADLFLREPLSLQKILGIMFAILGICLLAG